MNIFINTCAALVLSGASTFSASAQDRSITHLSGELYLYRDASDAAVVEP